MAGLGKQEGSMMIDFVHGAGVALMAIAAVRLLDMCWPTRPPPWPVQVAMLGLGLALQWWGDADAGEGIES